MKRNVFEFRADHHVQVSGSAIGTKIVPPYANIFMAALKPMEVWRYIDDCFMTVSGNTEKENCVFLRFLMC